MRTGNTVGRNAVTALLAAHKRGLLIAEVHSMAATASRISTAARLARMRVAGLAITVGCGTQTLWGLECNRPAMLSRLGAMRAVVYRRRRRQENVRSAQSQPMPCGAFRSRQSILFGRWQHESLARCHLGADRGFARRH